MPEPDLRRERIQFPLRALFTFTLLAAVLAAVARWLIRLDAPWPILASAAIGGTVGLTTVLIVRHVRLTCLLVTLLVAFVFTNGFWFSSHMIAYGSAVLTGGLIGWRGLDVLNALLGWCGFTVSKVACPKREPPED
jgi:hypothetical protein